MENKKGVSTVVASIVIVMLTVLVVIFISQFIIPYVKNNLYKSSECLDYQKYFSFDDSLRYNCKKTGTGYVLSIKAEGQKELEKNIGGLKLVFYRSGKIFGLEVKNGKSGNDTFFMIDKIVRFADIPFKVPKTGETQSYVYNVSELYNKVEVYTLLKSGRTCEGKNDEISLENCA
jgi:hypothetical protein